jgi:hypothetical protein
MAVTSAYQQDHLLSHLSYGMWPTAFALKELTLTEEARIAALMKQAVS